MASASPPMGAIPGPAGVSIRTWAPFASDVCVEGAVGGNEA